MWARYGKVGVGNFDGDGTEYDDYVYWISAMQNRCRVIMNRYSLKFQLYNQLASSIVDNGPDLSQSSVESESVNSLYDPPEVTTEATADKYLAEQNKTAFKQKNYSGLESSTYRQYMEDIPEDPMREFCEEFRDLFYWGL